MIDIAKEPNSHVRVSSSTKGRRQFRGMLGSYLSIGLAVEQEYRNTNLEGGW